MARTTVNYRLSFPNLEIGRKMVKCSNGRLNSANPCSYWMRSEHFRNARERLAKLALSVKDLSEATDHIQALLQSDPGNGSGHWLQGILLMQSQQCAEAALSFRRTP